MTEREAIQFYKNSFLTMFGSKIAVRIIEKPVRKDPVKIDPIALQITNMILLLEEVSYDDVLSDTRVREISDCRQLLFYVLLQMGYSCTVIGRWFRRHHATVLHAKECIQFRMKTDEQYAKRVDSIVAEVRKLA